MSFRPKGEILEIGKIKKDFSSRCSSKRVTRRVMTQRNNESPYCAIWDKNNLPRQTPIFKFLRLTGLVIRASGPLSTENGSCENA